MDIIAPDATRESGQAGEGGQNTAITPVVSIVPAAYNPRMRPVIGITCDTAVKPGGRIVHESTRAYAEAIARAGGTPVLLPHAVECIDDYLTICRGFVLTGGDDPATEPFGEPTHSAAKVMDPTRQRFETELLRRLDATTHPALGVCLGMQLMALHHGGELDQHLPDSHGPAAVARHADADHDIEPTLDRHALLNAPGRVHSHHHQAVADPGRLRVVAVCGNDEIIEAIDLPGERFYLGVQWHPERTADPALGDALFRSLVDASR